MSIKRRIVAYCTFCEKKGKNTLLVPYAKAESSEDYLCVTCWTSFSIELALEIHNRYDGQYRGNDLSKKSSKKVYVSSDGFSTTDGRMFAAHLRRYGCKLRYVKNPL